MTEFNRYAAGIRIGSAVLLETVPIAFDDSIDKRLKLLRSIRANGDIVRPEQEMFAKDLATVVRHVRDLMGREADEPFRKALQAFLDDLEPAQGRDRCSHCTSRAVERPLCAELSAWDSHLSAHVCIGQAAALLFDIERLARQEYGRHATAAQKALVEKTPVQFTVLPIAQGATHGFIPEFHVNGETHAANDASVVKIVLEDESLDLVTLRQLAYVAAHEVVCHAFQGLECPQREDVGADCHWSEGWMDTVAWMQLEQWLQTDADLPDWLTRSPTHEKALDACRELHRRRYRGPQSRSLPPDNLHQRTQARDACEALRKAWSGAGAALGMDKLVEFSLKLNVAALDHAQRDWLVRRLVNGLLAAPSSPMMDATVLVCELFLDNDDPQALMAEFEASGRTVYMRPSA